MKTRHYIAIGFIIAFFAILFLVRWLCGEKSLIFVLLPLPLAAVLGSIYFKYFDWL
ncbi:hypothetical protein ACVRXQ_11895 [Streptococcus panodentis]|uniref:hypothetical protein n=1 Tax=Streptococcus TaxID=1301 RepID=UPI000799CBD7|nr:MULTISPECIES: hypothetical protein [Streptococcus]KXT84076.1 hypothetical protein STRDD11_01122 [Streptococcus sp. DD11]